MRFGRIEWVEYLFRQLGRKPRSGIAEGQKNLFVFTLPRRDDYLPRSIDVFHRFDAVDDQVHDDLLQLHAIPDDAGQIGRQFRPGRYVVASRLAAQEGDGLPNDLVYINKLPLRRALLELRANSSDNLGGALCVS